MTPPTRPPFPVNARPGEPCPHCGAWVPASTHAGCPVRLKRAEERVRVNRERRRLFGIEWGGEGE